MMNRRSALKWLHWLSAALMLWFFLVEPEDVEKLGGAALATHAGMGVLLGLVVGIWLVLFLRKGLASRPGPKLPAIAKKAHPVMHRVLYWGSAGVVLSGALAGFAAPYVIKAFGLFPINPGFGGKSIHGLMEEIHEIAFDALMILIVAHLLFHVWRHFWLKDNALRIMVPKPLHKWL
ncbi:MAG: cytochrome b/b6 domain-containing protein [Pelagimonas sp.]|jgi:cytochrome b561|nr:cytochrome b/b6 domain-containing protein [Pelagimonas sp.]